MAITKTTTDVQFSAASTKSVAAEGNEVSDVVDIADNAVNGGLTFKTDHQGSPGTNSLIQVFIYYSSGDPDGAGSFEYPADITNGQLLITLDPNVTDPAVVSAPINVAYGKYQLDFYNDDTTSAQIVSAVYLEQVAS